MPRAVSNPPNPWHSRSVELLGPPPPLELLVYEEECQSIVSANESADVPFRFSVNPYRGCFHACAYCYARPTHQYLDWGAGTDFERRIVVKLNAAEKLREWLAGHRGRREIIAFSGVTDCYQPLEASYELTRACLDACREFRQPVGVITKGALVERDAELLARVNERAAARVYVSLAFADDGDARLLEPYAAPPSRRLATIARLAAAGVPVGVAVAPVILGLNDHQIPAILAAARAAGANRAFLTLLRLPAEVLPVFTERLREAFPARAEKVLSLLAQVRQGDLQDARIGHRMRGEGPRYAVVERLFDLHCRRLGLASRETDLAFEAQRPRQGELFGGTGGRSGCR